MSKSWKPAILRGLTFAQHVTTPFMATFILIHLSAPILATVGGSAFSSQVMILGREVYQSPFSEIALVYAPWAIHVAASLTKRTILGNPPQMTRLQEAAYAILVLLPVHVLTHRIYPSETAAPISALSPGELDYEYVKYVLLKWPWRSSLLYGGIVVYMMLHAVEGVGVLVRHWFPSLRSQGSKKLLSWVKWTSVWGTVAAVVAGVGVLATEPVSLPRSLEARIHTALTRAWFFGL